MAKKKQNKLTKWIVISLAAIAIFSVYSFSKNSIPESQQSSTGYQVYTDSTFGFSIEYPQVWEIRKDTQLFENGDAVAFRKTGPTQKEQTELTDGAQVVVAKPFTINTELATWAREYFGNQATYSKFTLAKYPYEAIENCSNLGCMAYYYTLVNGSVYGVAAFAQGPDSEKAAYENTIIYMLKSLQFNDSGNASVTKETAMSKVKALPEVIDYLKRVPNGLVLVNGEEGNSYLVQVYEVTNGHTATFNWYNVDKTTGEVEKQF